MIDLALDAITDILDGINFNNKKNKKNQLSNQSKGKQTIYWDVDDIILNTSETMVQLINKRYRIPSGLKPKTLNECKDWNFKGLWRDLTQQDIWNLFEEDEFWNAIKVNPEFFDIINSKILKKYNNVFVTIGTEVNLYKKREFLEQQLGQVMNDFEYLGLLHDQHKSSVDMSGGIQIDDNYNNLKYTNARLKILMKDNRETRYNNSYGLIDMPDNLYNVNYLNEIKEILEFNLIERL